MSLVMFALCVITAVQGSDPETVFVKRGDDLRLAGPQTLKLTELGVFFWKHNKINILKIDTQQILINPKHKGRAEFLKENNSLLLKNVTFNDSGVYTFEIHDVGNPIERTYNVKVQDPVSPVELEVVLVSNDSHTCYVNVTCGPISSYFNCSSNICSQDGQQNISASSHRVYYEKSSIICNHSNEVSWTSDKTVVEDLCYFQPKPSPSPSPPHPVWIKILPVVIVLVVVVVIVGVFMYKKRKKKMSSNEIGSSRPEGAEIDAEYEEPQEPSPSQDPTYSLVDFHTAPTPASPEDAASLHTMYAQVDKKRNGRRDKEMPLQAL